MASRGDSNSEDREKSKRIGALRELWPFVRPYRTMLAAALVALVLTAAISLVMPIAVRRVVDRELAPEVDIGIAVIVTVRQPDPVAGPVRARGGD